MAREVQQEPDPESLRSELKPTEVRVVRAVRKPFTWYIESNGKIEAAQVAELKFKAEGLLQELNIRNGKWAKKGALLARLEDSEAQLALKKARSSLKMAQFEYQSLMLNYGENELNSKHGDNIRESLRHNSGLEDAEIAREEARLRLAHTMITAPFTGLIANVQYKAGNYVNAGDKLCDIYNPGKLEVVSYILESELSRLNIGQKAKITPLSGSGEAFEAILTEINPQVNTAGLIDLKLTVQNPRGLLPGMNVVISLTIPQEEMLVIPKEAVVVRSGRQVVFVAEEGLAKWHYVTTGLDNGEEVEIVEGMVEGMEVIISNNLQLAHDAQVKINP